LLRLNVEEVQSTEPFTNADLQNLLNAGYIEYGGAGEMVIHNQALAERMVQRTISAAEAAADASIPADRVRDHERETATLLQGYQPIPEPAELAPLVQSVVEMAEHAFYNKKSGFAFPVDRLPAALQQELVGGGFAELDKGWITITHPEIDAALRADAGLPATEADKAQTVSSDLPVIHGRFTAARVKQQQTGGDINLH
jgi:hypothetical protein